MWFCVELLLWLSTDSTFYSKSVILSEKKEGKKPLANILLTFFSYFYVGFVNTYRTKRRWNSFIIKFVFYIYVYTIHLILLYICDTRRNELLNIEPKTNNRLLFIPILNLFHFFLCVNCMATLVSVSNYNNIRLTLFFVLFRVINSCYKNINRNN